MLNTIIAFMKDADDVVELMDQCYPGIEKVVKAAEPYGRLFKETATEAFKGVLDVRVAGLDYMRKELFVPHETAMRLIELPLTGRK